MMTKIINELAKLNPRVLQGMMVFLIALLVFEGWILLLRKPYAEYQQILTTKELLSTTLHGATDQKSELVKLSAELKQLSEKLGGELRLPASDDKMAASLMEELDHSAATFAVSLSSVKPMERKSVSVFEEVSFEVSAKGAYLQLCQWMLDFEKTLGNNATVTEFDMQSAEEGHRVLLSLKIALYRPLEINELAR